MLSDFLLICYLLGLTRMFPHSHIGYPIPMWSIANSSASKRERRKIMKRSGIVLFLVKRLLTDQRDPRNLGFHSLFRRLFTGPESDTVAHLFLRPIIDLGLFASKHQLFPESQDCLSIKIHPILPIVISVEFSQRTKQSIIGIKILSDNRRQVLSNKTFKQDILAPNLTLHPTLPFLASNSGRIPNILELQWLDSQTQLSTSVTIYQLYLDGSLPTRIAELKGQHKSPVTAVAFCPNDSLRITTGDNGGSIRIWDICHSTRSTRCVFMIDSPYMPPNVISYCLVSSIIWLTSNTLVAGQKDRSMHFVKMSPDGNFENKAFKANPTEKFPFSCGNLDYMALHPSGRLFVTVVNYFTLIIWDASSLEILSTLKFPDEIYSMSFNSLGTLLIVGCVKNLVFVGVSPNGDNMQILAQNQVHKRFVTAVANHSNVDETCILSGSFGGSLVLSKI
jgi:WD40 repeat protein